MEIRLTLKQALNSLEYDDLLTLLVAYYAINDYELDIDSLDDEDLEKFREAVESDQESVIEDIEETLANAIMILNTNDLDEHSEECDFYDDYEDEGEDEDWDECVENHGQDGFDKSLEYLRNLGFDTSELER